MLKIKQMDYSELEKKVINKGKGQFIEELRKASIPMLAVLQKYGIGHKHKLLKEITLYVPYSSDKYFQYAIDVSNDSNLDYLDKHLLDLFMKEIEDIQERIDDLGLD